MQRRHRGGGFVESVGGREITKILNLCVEFGELYGYYRHFGVEMDLASRVAVSLAAQTHESSGSS
jgi:hypothetical protein